MSILLDINDSAIKNGIKTVGIGKKGSQSLSPELISQIIAELKEGQVTPAAKGAFFGALILKGVTNEELALGQAFENPDVLLNPERLVESIASPSPGWVKDICIQLLQEKTLDGETAHRLGQFLLSNKPCDGSRGMIASILRVRYETPDEYEGLLKAIQETISEKFQTPVPEGNPIIQISEPFDGVDHSYMITPLLAQYIQKQGYRVISMIGRNSGPKFETNLFDIAQKLNATYLTGNQDLRQPAPAFGWFCRQEDLSQYVDRWVDIRHQIIKRPFMATLEKFVNPAQARIMISSAFHPQYTEKMITISERAGFPGAVVIRNGLEGTLAFALKRPVKIMCSARQKDDSYLRHEFEIDPEEFLKKQIPVEEKLSSVSAEENVRLIRDYQQKGSTDNSLFNDRVKISCTGLSLALNWLKQHIQT